LTPQRTPVAATAQIAVDGCMHGELDIVYDMLRTLEEAEGIKIDLLLCYGDFQRSVVALVGAVPLRYRAQGEETEAHDQEQGVVRQVACQEADSGRPRDNG